MFEITCLDAKEEVITNFTQWDTDQTIKIKNVELESAPLVHFCNKNSKEALVVKSTLVAQTLTVTVPNIILQEGIPLFVYLYYYSASTAHPSEKTSGRTVAMAKIPVRPRPRPSDYEYVGNIDVVSLAQIEERIEQAIQDMEEAKQDANTKVEAAQKDINNLKTELSKKIPLSQKGVANGVASLDGSGLVLTSQLPSYVDDVIEGTLSTFPKPGDRGKIYVDTTTNLTYRWSGSIYVEISKSLALGTTATTAYPGDKGQQNADDIAALKQRVSANENNINDLKSKVSTNTTDIAGLKTKVSTNTTNIEGLKKSVSNIETNITNIEGDITSIQGDVSSLRTDVDRNTSDIGEMKKTQSGQASDISKLKTDVSGHTQDIAGLKTSTNKNATDISGLTERVTTNESDIDDIQDDVRAMMSDITGIKKGEITVAGSAENSIDVDGHIIYGAYFCDVDEEGQVFLREDGSGNYLIATAINRTVFAKDLSGRISTSLDEIIARISALERTMVVAE